MIDDHVCVAARRMHHGGRKLGELEVPTVESEAVLEGDIALFPHGRGGG